MNVLDVVWHVLGALLGLSISIWFVVISRDLATGFVRFEKRIERSPRRAPRTEVRDARA